MVLRTEENWVMEPPFFSVGSCRMDSSMRSSYCEALCRPLKRKNISRLELLGCLALTRIYNTCKEALVFVNFHEYNRTFWTDSRTVLTWIKTPPREIRPFVSVRVAKSKKQWDQNNSATSNPGATLQMPLPGELLLASKVARDEMAKI